MTTPPPSPRLPQADQQRPALGGQNMMTPQRDLRLHQPEVRARLRRDAKRGFLQREVLPNFKDVVTEIRKAIDSGIEALRAEGENLNLENIESAVETLAPQIVLLHQAHEAVIALVDGAPTTEEEDGYAALTNAVAGILANAGANPAGLFQVTMAQANALQAEAQAVLDLLLEAQEQLQAVQAELVPDLGAAAAAGNFPEDCDIQPAGGNNLDAI